MPVKKTFVFYSKFCRDEFEGSNGGQRLLLTMAPFSYFGRLASNYDRANNYLLFFGRISKYKGVDLLLDAMPKVLEQFPAEELIVAGSGADAGLLNHPTLHDPSKNTRIINRFIENEELVDLISKSKFVICPYLDATQRRCAYDHFCREQTRCSKPGRRI